MALELLLRLWSLSGLEPVGESVTSRDRWPLRDELWLRLWLWLWLWFCVGSALSMDILSAMPSPDRGLETMPPCGKRPRGSKRDGDVGEVERRVDDGRKCRVWRGVRPLGFCFAGVAGARRQRYVQGWGSTGVQRAADGVLAVLGRV